MILDVLYDVLFRASIAANEDYATRRKVALKISAASRVLQLIDGPIQTDGVSVSAQLQYMKTPLVTEISVRSSAHA